MHPAPRARLEVFVAATALLVSLTTLGVYLYQARVMGQQQRVSVWPYLEWSTTNIDGYHFSVRNKGVGPALISKVVMKVDGRVIKNNRELITAVLGPDWTLHGYVNSYLERRVLSPGEEVVPFRITDPKEGRDFEAKLQQHPFEMEITYASVYGDTWVCAGSEVVRLPVKQPSLY